MAFAAANAANIAMLVSQPMKCRLIFTKALNRISRQSTRCGRCYRLNRYARRVRTILALLAISTYRNTTPMTLTIAICFVISLWLTPKTRDLV